MQCGVHLLVYFTQNEAHPCKSRDLVFLTKEHVSNLSGFLSFLTEASIHLDRINPNVKMLAERKDCWMLSPDVPSAWREALSMLRFSSEAEVCNSLTLLNFVLFDHILAPLPVKPLPISLSLGTSCRSCCEASCRRSQDCSVSI